MKPLLRVVLILDALLLTAFGLLFVLTPWTSLYDGLHLVQTQPALVGQAFGVALIGLAWLAVHASFDGALTSKVAKVVGHVHWLTGVLMLAWLLGLRTPPLPSYGQLVTVLAAVVLVVVGLGGVRLAGAVRRREKGIVAGKSSGKADKKAAKEAQKQADKDAVRQREVGRRVEPDGVREPQVTAGFPVYHAEPAPEPVVPVTRPVNPAAAASATPGSASVASTTPLHPVSGGTERAAAASGDAHNDAPRPPFHG
ncbi:hypothetical protein LJ656_18275 [Paraburkholderia sp. MMS20-SJTR3]|uniref:Transmembrane protein n=1 Tax=Paraburkholderia sejongensis TaxID=2886946 RepID=A0ABS8JXB0_9BURK|nr:hypothetical protein [Paraburkholderia sp. MMS20-SJTR3]MCC8394542.1 hypothetical protein [Paraburkholderia sp. MMS20-SJTR3]